jgi:flavin reductase
MNQAQTVQLSMPPVPSTGMPGAGEPTLLRHAFVAAMGLAVTGVNLLTTDGAKGRFGLTVSAVSSVSADPPLLLACVNSRSPAAAAITGNGTFCVSILGADQHHVADTFAGRPPQGRAPFDFGCADWAEEGSGFWRLQDAVATFDCALEYSLAGGSHLVFIGRVLKASPSGQARPKPALAYSRRAYGRATPIGDDSLKGLTQ